MKFNFLKALVAIVGLAIIGAPVTVKAQSTTNNPAATPPDTSTTAKVKEKKHSDKTPYTGSITAIDASSLTVAMTTKTLTLAIAPTTKFATLEGKKKTAAQASDFAVGDKVTGSYTTDASGATTAASVHKKAAATK